PAPAWAESWVVCDNGLRCVMAPCPSYNALNLADGTNGRITGVDMRKLSEADRTHLSPDLEKFVLHGRIERRELRHLNRRAIETSLSVSAVERPTTTRE